MFDTTKMQMLDMFLDRTAGETFSHNRLITRETDAGEVALVAYGWLKLAVYNEQRDAVTVFSGHKALKSKTINTYLNDVVRRANNRGRDVILSGESPTVDTPNDGTEFIGNYIGQSGITSPVEADAQKKVRDSLSHLA